jgi:dihydroorotate dehydrogenase (fumarate)
VRRWYELVGQKMSIVGCGGVSTAEDAMQHLLAGASAVQVGTQLMSEGPAVFSRLVRELQELLQRKSSTLSDVIGRAQARDRQLATMVDY